jgi:TetR/AcrR family transcriptional regulator
MRKYPPGTDNSPKRRVSRGASVAKEKIVKAAIQEFAAKGFDGARVDEIARRAGLNKTLLYHHIGNKDSLFTAALEAAYQTIRGRQRESILHELPPKEGLQELVRLLMDIWVKNPKLGRLLANENFLGGRHVRKSKVIRELYNPLVATLNDLLKRGVESGDFRDGIDPIDLYISISALSAYYVSHRHTLSTLFQVDLMSERRLRQRESHVINMILSYVCRQAGEAARRSEIWSPDTEIAPIVEQARMSEGA